MQQLTGMRLFFAIKVKYVMMWVSQSLHHGCGGRGSVFFVLLLLCTGGLAKKVWESLFHIDTASE